MEKIADNAKKDREEAEERNAKRDEANIARYEAAQAKSDAEKKELIDKLAELTAAANVAEGGVILTQIAKYERVLNEFRKSIKVKEFSPVVMTVDDWIQSVIDEVKIIALSKGFDMTTLTDKQRIYIVLSKLPQKIVQQLDAYCKREDKTFDTVSYKRFEELFQKYGGVSVPAVTSVMNLFGIDRNKRNKDLPMLHHVLDFDNKLPTCVTPKDELESLQKFADLIKRSAFFASIDCPEIRKALMKIPESEATYLEFTKVAQETDELMRGQKKCAETMEKMDGAKHETTTSVLKLESNSEPKGVSHNYKRGRGGNRGGSYNRGGSHGSNRGGNRNQSHNKDQSSSQSEITCSSCGANGHKSPVSK